jgi:enoyl-CoA hydratase/carnithine racemase
MSTPLTWSAVTGDLTASEADGVLTLSIATPAEMNRMTPDALAKLEQLATALRHRDDINAVVVTGAGSEHFSTGLLNPKLRASLSKHDIIALVRLANRAFDALAAAPQVVIAALNGPMRAGGCELALACDIRIAADTVTMHLPEAMWGGFPGAGGPMRLAEIVGRGKALQLIATGATIDAREMLRLGLVEEVVPAAELRTLATEMAQRIAAAGPLATRGAKRIIRTRLDASAQAAAELADALRYALEWSEDVDESHAAQAEGRAPRFRGR